MLLASLSWYCKQYLILFLSPKTPTNTEEKISARLWLMQTITTDIMFSNETESRTKIFYINKWWPEKSTLWLTQWLHIHVTVSHTGWVAVETRWEKCHLCWRWAASEYPNLLVIYKNRVNEATMFLSRNTEQFLTLFEQPARVNGLLQWSDLLRP